MHDAMLSIRVVRTVYRHKKLMFDLFFEIKRVGGRPAEAFLNDLLEKCDKEVQLTAVLNKRGRLLSDNIFQIPNIKDVIVGEISTYE